ncbi:hypothetical protein BBO_03069 [Beauveria brongniartii RCEF 3172]|uniref:Uncharacterized protein n=1 Tax=Beauveria brongniartii RCEF 3172 TaxID=1081107 RepID=A0A167GE96_9HYPO|nr:hypothetical protein BBO_03069 [Beauveria brongniartii RCEF 3172]
MRFTNSFSFLALLGMPALSVATVIARADTRFGTKHWYGAFWDPHVSCGRDKVRKCHPTKEHSLAMLWDQLNGAFDQLCREVTCSGSFDVMYPGYHCNSGELGDIAAFTLRIDAIYAAADRDAIKATYLSTLRSLGNETSDCEFWMGINVNQVRVDFPTDINIIVKETKKGPERSALHIMLDNRGESNCRSTDRMWKATNDTIPGGDLFGPIHKGNCQ